MRLRMLWKKPTTHNRFRKYGLYKSVIMDKGILYFSHPLDFYKNKTYEAINKTPIRTPCNDQYRQELSQRAYKKKKNCCVSGFYRGISYNYF